MSRDLIWLFASDWLRSSFCWVNEKKRTMAVIYRNSQPVLAGKGKWWYPEWRGTAHGRSLNYLASHFARLVISVKSSIYSDRPLLPDQMVELKFVKKRRQTAQKVGQPPGWWWGVLKSIREQNFKNEIPETREICKFQDFPEKALHSFTTELDLLT